MYGDLQQQQKYVVSAINYIWWYLWQTTQSSPSKSSVQSSGNTYTYELTGLWFKSVGPIKSIAKYKTNIQPESSIHIAYAPSYLKHFKQFIVLQMASKSHCSSFSV